MLGIKKSGAGVTGSTTLISRDTTVVGEIHFSGTLDVEGVVQGNIVAKPGQEALVRVVGSGRVEGEIHAPLVVINGCVEGDVHSSKQLELAARGSVQGDVYYSSVEMVAGSEVNGSLTHVSAADDAINPSKDEGNKVD